MGNDHETVKHHQPFLSPAETAERLHRQADEQIARTIPPGTLRHEPPVVLDKRPLKR